MATTYSEFDTTVANLVADMKAKILLSTDWANITGNVVKATTTRGAQMVVDLADAAATARQLQLGVYRTHDGTTGVDKLTRYVVFRVGSAAPVTADPVHCRVSAGKEHLFFSVEGSRVGEPNPDSASVGSSCSYFFLGDIVPYFSGDTIPAVALLANATTTAHTSSQVVYVSRNAADTTSWVTAKLATLTYVRLSDLGATSSVYNFNRTARGDSSKVYLSPYVVFEDIAGLRGRIAKAFFAGWNENAYVADTGHLQHHRWSYDGENYLIVPVGWTYHSSTENCLAFGHVKANTNNYGASVLVAIPYA